MSDYTIADLIDHRQQEFRIHMQPKYTWKCQLVPNVFWHIEEGKQPNAFHRFMQKLCFGFKWSRIEE